MITFYNMATSKDPTTLAQKINGLIKKGYQPLGGPFYAQGLWYQAVIKDNKADVVGDLMTGYKDAIQSIKDAAASIRQEGGLL